MQNYEHIKFDHQGAIAIIELNRPNAANGLDAKMASELRRAAKQCDGDPALKAVILRASGRFFCAGGDLKEMLANGDEAGEAVKALADDLHAAISILSRMQAGLIVAVNGVAAGAGFSLALIGDLVVAAQCIQIVALAGPQLTRQFQGVDHRQAGAERLFIPAQK